MQFRDLPVRRKLMTIVLFVSGTVSVLTCATLLSYDYVTFRSSTRETTATLGAVVAENSTAALAFLNRDDATAVLAAFRAETLIVGEALYDADGRLFAKYPASRPDGAFPGRPAEDGNRFTPTRLVDYQPILMDGRRLGTLYLEADRGAIYQRLRVYGGLLALLAAFSFVLAYTLSARLQREISRPILDLTATARAVSQGNYSLRATRLGGAELGVLTDAFNHMLAEIEQLNRELEQRVAQRTAQLQVANKELEAFSYSVSHDLRAPLRHIDGFAQLLGKHLGTSLDATARRHLATITESARRLGVLIDELLVFSRMGRTELRQAPVPMRPLVEEVVRELQPEIRERTVEWRIGELPSVRADASMLRQVWANLLGNAIKYSRQRAVAHIEIECRRDGADGHVFSVRDDGAGFDMKYAEKLFGVFQRLHSASEFEGTGIGLANVQRIVQRHHGRVWAEGRPGEGATFYFTLPATV